MTKNSYLLYKYKGELFTNIIYKITGKKKKLEEQATELSNQKLVYEEQFEKLLNQRFPNGVDCPENIDKDTFFKLFSIYYDSVSAHYNYNQQDGALVESIEGAHNVISVLAGDTKYPHLENDSFENLQKSLLQETQSRLSTYEMSKEKAKQELAVTNNELSKEKLAMSTEAQNIIDNKLLDERVFARLPSFLNIKTNNKGRHNYVVSPLTASLILETLMVFPNLKTIEDVEKYGITITDEEVKKASNQASKQIFSFLNKMQKRFIQQVDNEER